jgi:hypothetical protein
MHNGVRLLLYRGTQRNRTTLRVCPKRKFAATERCGKCLRCRGYNDVEAKAVVPFVRQILFIVDSEGKRPSGKHYQPSSEFPRVLIVNMGSLADVDQTVPHGNRKEASYKPHHQTFESTKLKMKELGTQNRPRKVTTLMTKNATG